MRDYIGIGITIAIGLFCLNGCTASQKIVKANSSAIHGIRTGMGKLGAKVSRIEREGDEPRSV